MPEILLRESDSTVHNHAFEPVFTDAVTTPVPDEPAVTPAADQTFHRLQRDIPREAGEPAATGTSAGAGIYTEVIAQIKALLREGQFLPGDKLPSERELAEKLGVNRNALREAIRALTVMGVIQTRPQSGSHLSPSVEGMLRLPFEFLMLMLRPTYDQIHELRSLIELYAAGRAAEMRTDSDLEQMETLLEELRNNSGIVPSGTWNVRFHRRIAAATQNPLIEHVSNCLLEARSLYIKTNRTIQGGRESVENHQRILDAIRRRDSPAARLAMQEDMDTAIRVGRKIHSPGLPE